MTGVGNGQFQKGNSVRIKRVEDSSNLILRDSMHFNIVIPGLKD